MLRLTLEHAGIVVVTAMTWEIREGEIDLERFVAQHRPKVIIYDISPPYESNWMLFQHLRSLPPLVDLRFIVTTTNAKQVEHFAKSGEPVYEIVGKPFDLGEIVNAVREALKARATR